MKRVLVYSHDTFGLGNIRRMLEVSRHLVASSPDVAVLVVTGSPMLHAFRLPARIDFIKLPCLARDVEGRYAARSLPMGLEETVRLRANMIRSTLIDFKPDLVVVDKKPFGVEDELSGALEAMSGMGTKPALVLLLRDILDGQAVTSAVWKKNGYFDAIDTWYDRVLVVGSPEVFDLRSEYDFPKLAAAKVLFCGYIAREPGRQTRAQVRRRLALDDHEPFVLVTPGGGADGSRMVETTLAGLMAQPAQWRPPHPHRVWSRDAGRHRGPRHGRSGRASVADRRDLQRRHDVAAGRGRRGGLHGWLQHRVRVADLRPPGRDRAPGEAGD